MVLRHDCIFSDLIKNKTLEYLSRSLPFLKEQQNLPKVARFSGPVQVQASSPMGPVYRFRRALKDEAVNTSTIRVNNHGVRADKCVLTAPPHFAENQSFNHSYDLMVLKVGNL